MKLTYHHDCALHLLLPIIYVFPVIVCVSVDSGVEVPSSYLDDPCYTPRQQGKR